MANITLAGTLRDPGSELAVGDQIRFTHQTSTGETLPGAITIVTINAIGTYSIELQYGVVKVEYKDVKNPTFKVLGVVIVNSDNTATSIPELMNATVPTMTNEMIAFVAVLADCVTEKTAAVAANTAAQAVSSQLTTAGLIASTVTFSANIVIKTSGYTTSGTGSGSWKQNSVTGQTASQSPAQLASALLNDANGNQWALVVTDSVDVKSFGATGDDVTDDLLAFNAAGASGATEIIITPGDYNLSADAVSSSDVVWVMRRGAYFTGIGALVTDNNNIISYAPYYDNPSAINLTWMGVAPLAVEYLAKNAVISGIASLGAIGIMGAARASKQSGGSAIGTAGFSYNDNTTSVVRAWGLYSEATCGVGAMGTTFGEEIAMATLDSYVDSYDASIQKTIGLLIASGAASQFLGGAAEDTTQAINIQQNGTRFGRGLMFDVNSLRLFTDSGGVSHGKAVILRNSHQIGWENGSGDSWGFVRSRISNTLNETAVELKDNIVDLMGYQNTSIGIFQHNSNAVNHLKFQNSVTAFAPIISAEGTNANIDLRINPKGTGKVRIGTTFFPATNAANFTADNVLELKDAAGIVYRIPCRTSLW